MKNNPDFETVEFSKLEKFFLEMAIIFHGCYLVTTILINGFKVLSHKRSIFNGELLK